MPNISLNSLQALKQKQEKITMLTCYDAIFAHTASKAGVEILLVGDSLGMVLQGNDSTVPVSIEDMAYHTQCVSRGNKGALVLGDLPFMSYATASQALESAAMLMQAGAHMIKMEGGQWLAESVSLLAERGIPSCVHLGLTPQSVNVLGGYKVQGRQEAQAQKILNDALALESAGAALIVLECIPSDLAARITQALSIPVIGIGAGPETDGQVLVLHDMLGLGFTEKPLKFVYNFMQDASSISTAIEAYVSAVKSSRFPAEEHGFSS